MGRRISFTKGFKAFKRKYGTKAAIQYLQGYCGITRGKWGKFEKKAREALKKKKRSFNFP